MRFCRSTGLSFYAIVSLFAYICSFISSQVVLRSPLYTKLPLLVAGHSMGGCIAALTAIRLEPRVEGLLLFSAMIDVQRTKMMMIQELVAPVLNGVIPNRKMVRAVRIEELSNDKDVVQGFYDVS